MRIEKLRPIIFLVLVVGCAVPVRAQSLAEVARQEEARRQATGSAGKTYTNTDLRPVAPSSAAPASPATAAVDKAVVAPAELSADAADSNDVTPDQDSPKEIEANALDPDKNAASTRGKAYWLKRMSDIRAQLDRDTSYAEAMKTRVDVLTLDYTNRADVGQRIRVGMDRQKAMTDLEQLTKAVADGKKAIADLDEEARQAGAPPGWLR